jgi:predicted dehydrogenase
MSAQAFGALLLVGGRHHDFEQAPQQIAAALGPGFDVTITDDLSALDSLQNVDLLAVYACGRDDELSDTRAKAIEQFVRNGGGLLGIHSANASFTNNPTWMKLIGSRFAGHGPVMEFPVNIADPDHPVVARTTPFVVTDELYVIEPTADYQVFATAHWQGRDMPTGYQRHVGSGRVLWVGLGHDSRSLGNVYTQRMLQRAGRVAAGQTFDKTFTAGILGYGGAFNMGLKHAQAIDQQAGASVTAVCDLDPQRTDQARQELGDIQTTNDPQRFVEDFDFDLCVQILPHNLHAEWCIKAAQAGRHVVTEKPFCITLDEADRMIAAAQDAQKMLSCFHNRRWDGDFRTMLQLVRAGEVGEVFRIDGALGGYGRPGAWWRSSKAISGGQMYDWGAHYCDWILNLVPKRIESVTGDYQKRHWHHVTNEDYTFALVRFEDGTTATLEQGSLIAVTRNGFRILGTEGGIANTGPGGDLTVRRPGVHGLNETAMKVMPGHWEGYYANVANHLIMGEELVVTPAQARRAIGVLHLAERSAAEGGKPLPLPGEDSFEPHYLWPW